MAPEVGREVVEAAATALEQHYVFPEIGKRMAGMLRQGNISHDYDAIATGQELSQRLTEGLDKVAHDRHVRVHYKESGAYNPEATSAEQARFRHDMAWRNYGFVEARRLAGNLGYLRLDSLVGTDMAGDTAKGAMAVVSATDALIMDLRWNGGGTPEMVDLLCTYLFPPGQRVHLNDFEQTVEPKHVEFFTLPSIPGKSYAGKDVYILTSHDTFSAAEELAYDLKALKRATLVGEVTGGGANPGRIYSLPAQFSIFIPFGRAVNPITKTNWEGLGVQPDVAVPADKALDVAQYLALTKLRSTTTEPGPEQDEVSGRLRQLAGELGSMVRVAESSRTRTEVAPGTWTGRVSDRKCGRKVDRDCNRRCIAGGEPPVLVLDGTDELVSIANPESLRPYPGAHVQVKGALSGTVLTVVAVKPLGDGRD